jgi:hypothetical protein
MFRDYLNKISGVAYLVIFISKLVFNFLFYFVCIYLRVHKLPLVLKIILI